MKAVHLIIIAVLLLPKLLLSAEIAVIPYRVINSSKYFKASTGGEYAKILSVAGLYKKNIRITSFFDLKKDMKSLGLKSSELISKEDLITMGRVHRIDYFLLGSLIKNREMYISKSILFSVKEKRVMIRDQLKASSLFSLAEKEARRMFLSFTDRKQRKKNNQVDLGFVVDLSYSSKLEWPQMRSKIHALSARLIDSHSINLAVKFFPWSHNKLNSYKSKGHVTGFKKYLKTLRPRGRENPSGLKKKLYTVLQNTEWRRGSKKILYIISNTALNDAFFVDRYTLLARRRGVTIYTITLGNLSGKKISQFWRLSSMTQGKNYRAAYYQKIFDKNGQPIHLHLENGRLFTSASYEETWKRGLLTYSQDNMSYSRPRSWLDEIQLGNAVIPGKMVSVYTKKKQVMVLTKKKIHHNTGTLLQKGFSTALKSILTLSDPVGRVLVSDGAISLWLSIDSQKMMARLSGSSGYKYLAGHFVKDSSSPYGISFKVIDLRINNDTIPARMLVSLKQAVKKRSYYIRNGLYKPSLWFIRIKVEQTKQKKRKTDIRDF